MHPGQYQITARQARGLIAAQMPDLAGLALRHVGAGGTDNVLLRLGADLVARFPRLPHAAAQIAREARWLPALAAALPLAVPLATRHGEPDADYPFSWSVGPWLPGRDAFAAPPEQMAAAKVLAGFLIALRAQPIPPGAPSRIEADSLQLRLGGSEHFIAQFQDEADPSRLRHLLRLARALPAFQGKPVWQHGDLHPLNLLTRRGKLSAAIDWGSMGLGDPATDLMAGWTLFDPPAREAFRQAMQPAPDAWARGRALAFTKAVAAIPYYRTSNPRFRDVMKVTLARLLADWPDQAMDFAHPGRIA